ncbi:fibronectin type III domain-containing protein [Chitinophaga sp. HK235]|uniref:fibronectin type III domain-containing protein n=1 Tax=Chitinophaga sp. HK235 TaxID=2952571 RepID=UPI001BAA1672|nr:fibronectin type III domain-containing protein [Chitinophaga sp. HK235]
MTPVFRFLLCMTLLLFIQKPARAQQYPVTASTQIIPPYSVYLPDYAVPGSDKLRVILVQNDLTKPSYDVRLQMTVERNGTLIMRTAPAFNPRPLTLSAGVPTIISGTDLADYLNTNNIEFSGGFSRDSDERTRSLPEGSYRITFTAFDYRRPQVQVSNAGANIFFFQKNDPPLLNMPICGSRVEKRDPQFLTFSWSSRNTPNPLDGGGTAYIFSLYEIKPKNSNPDYIVRSTRPIYTITTEQNTIAYGPGEPALTDSMEYVWIVQARDKSGRDMFSNQGLSQSCRFTYLGNNPFEINKIGKPGLSGQATGERTIRLSWQLAPDNVNYKVDAYRIQYRATKKDGVEYDWRTAESPRDTVLNINSLEPGRSYEARLQWLVAGVYGPFSDIVTVTTKPSRIFTCGDPALLQTPQNNTPLPAAMAGSIFRIGHFDVMLTEVTGGDGVFSGRGKAITPGFGTGMLLQFNRISVNTDLVVTRGEMQAVTDGIDKFVGDAVKHQRGGDEVGQVKTGDLVPDITTKLHLFTKDNIVVDTDKGTITLKDSNTGQEEVINYKEKGKALPLVIEDTDGNLYNVDKSGKVTAAGTRDKGLAGDPAALAALNTLNLSNGMITFSVKDNKYAFDSWKDSYFGKPVLDSSYEKLADGRYRVSAKAIVPGEQDQVIATLVNAKDIDRSKIRFVSGKGIVYPADSTKDGFIITLTGGPASDAQEVYAVYTRGGKYISMGKLLVASYAPKQKRVVLVPVGYDTDVPVDAISKALKDAYEKIGVTYTVKKDESFRANKDWDLNKDTILQDSRSAFLGNGFTGEEKAMRKAYSKNHDIDKDATYLFVVNEVALTDGDLLGKMPRQSQFGFIFTKNATPENIACTVAHETGHGAFTLEHTFSAGIGLDRGSTDNLMDYNNGYNLLKYQWDVVHDPGHVWGIFENDQEQESVGYDSINVFKDLRNEATNTYTFITPAGTYITLPATASNLKFSTLDRTFYKLNGVANVNQPSEDLMPLGALLSFDLNKKAYAVDFTGKTFNGYGIGGKDYYEDVYTGQEHPRSGIAVFMGVGEDPVTRDRRFISYASRFGALQATISVPSTYYGAGIFNNNLAVTDINFIDAFLNMEGLLRSKMVGNKLLVLPMQNLYLTNANTTFPYKGGQNISISKFLLSVLAPDSPVKDYITFYTVANLKANELEGFKDCMGMGIRIEDFIQSYRKMQLQTVDPSYGPRLFAKVKELTMTELAMAAKGNINLVTDLHTAVLAGKPAADIHTILVNNYSKCAMNALELKDRLYILNQLLGKVADNDLWYTDPHWYTSNDGHFIVKDLLQTAPQKDRLEILKSGLIAKDYQWLRTLWREGNKWLNGVGYDDVRDVFDLINPWVLENYAALGIQPTQKTSTDQMNGTGPVKYYPGEQEFLIGADPVQLYHVNKFFDYWTHNSGTTAEFNDAGKVVLEQEYTIRELPDPLLDQLLEGRPRNTIVDIELDEAFNPLEPVTIMAVRNFHENGFDAGDRHIVPAYMAMVYNTDVARTTNSRTVREVVDFVAITAAILATPETGGGSLAAYSAFALRTAGIVGSMDVLVQRSRNNLTLAEYTKYRDFYEAWDKVKATSDYASLLAGVGNGLAWGASKLNGFRIFNRTIAGVGPILDGTPTALGDLSNAWNTIRNIPKTPPPGGFGFSLSNSRLFVNSRGLLLEGVAGQTKLARVAGFAADARVNAIFSVGAKEGVLAEDLVMVPRQGMVLSASKTTGAITEYVDEIGGAIGDVTTTMAGKGELVVTAEGMSVTVVEYQQGAGSVATMVPAAYNGTANIISYSIAGSPAGGMADIMVATRPNYAPQLLYASAKAYELILTKVKEKEKCIACKRFTEEICKKFDALYKKAGFTNSGGIRELCARLSSKEVSSVLDYLLAMPLSDLTTFLGDINVTSDNVNHISQHVEELDTRILEAWKVVATARKSVSVNYQADFPALKEVKLARASSSFMTNIGQDEGFVTALSPIKGMPCKTCKNASKPINQYLSEYVKDFKYFSDYYNFEGLWNDLKQQRAIGMVYGAAFQLRVLRAYPELFNGTVVFDANLDDTEDGLQGDDLDGTKTKCRFDIKVITPTDIKYLEFKSWGASTVRDFLGNASKRSAFSKQLGVYFKNVSDLNQLSCIFDSKKLSLDKAKGVVQAAFRDRFAEWYDSDDSGLGDAKMQQLFKLNKRAFEAAINDLNSQIYKFVKVL